MGSPVPVTPIAPAGECRRRQEVSFEPRPADETASVAGTPPSQLKLKGFNATVIARPPGFAHKTRPPLVGPARAVAR